MATNITPEHRRLFDALIGGECGNFALISTTFDGEPTAAIAAVTRDGADYVISPVAVLLTDSMFDRMTDPSEGLA
jgi:hypothetical protein